MMWRRARVLVCFGLYALVVLLSPVLHHDFACHLKSPTHCTACTASPSAPRTEHVPVLEARPLPDAGKIEALSEKAGAATSFATLSGRSPPV